MTASMTADLTNRILKQSFQHAQIEIHGKDVLSLYENWPTPTVIMSDGPYGLNSYNGDLKTSEGLDGFYRPHVEAWTRAAGQDTTLWFWNSELGWATVHPLLVEHGWRFVNCHIWNKGISHIAGNTNTKTLRKFPVVTEVCVQYVREPKVNGKKMHSWLRSEWIRSGLPLSHANEACGVKDAATRKYLTQDHLWYFPPPNMFVKLVNYANKHGDPAGKPYFVSHTGLPFTEEEWSHMRAKFHCSIGMTNVWNEPAIHGNERIKGEDGKNVHPNQKPLKIIQMLIETSSDIHDMVWEPFGGLCTAAVACLKTDRKCHSAEIDEDFYQIAIKRLTNAVVTDP
ncbi:MAG: DNA methyltransferase [Thaumarchaeota archaeon]|nr:DNA methyltransferase [Nitrososphaerota archaeon]